MTKGPDESIGEKGFRTQASASAAYRDLGKPLHDAGRGEEAIAAFERGIAGAARTNDVQTMKEIQVFLKRLKD